MSTPYDFEADPPTPRQRAIRGTVQALVGMGAEKNADALASIEKALAADPDNKEYLATRDLIKKSMKK